MLSTIILFLAVLSVLVLAHEWGHYFAAKKIGAKVEEFGLGFPPRLFSWKGKDGMRWSLNVIPLGGFVKIKGESGGHEQDPGAFRNKSIPKRILVLAAGVVMNFVLAAVLFSVLFLVGIPSITEGEVDAQVMIRDHAVRVTEVLPDSPAEEAGLHLGDKILAVNGTPYSSGEEVREALNGVEANTVIELQVEGTDNEQRTLAVAPAHLEEVGRTGIGVGIADTGIARYPWYLAPVKGIETTVAYTGLIVTTFAHIITDAVSGQPVTAELSGPVGIAVLTGEVANLGWMYLLQFAAILSINLAIINILPFPALDGGRIAFVLYEAVRRKPASPKLEAIVHNVGFIVLIVLIIFVTYRDILQLG